MRVRFGTQQKAQVKTQQKSFNGLSLNEKYEQHLLLESSELFRRKAADILKRLKGIETVPTPLTDFNSEAVFKFSEKNQNEYIKIMKTETPFKGTIKIDSYIKKLVVFFYFISDSSEWKYKTIQHSGKTEWIFCSEKNVLITDEDHVIFDCGSIF